MIKYFKYLFFSILAFYCSCSPVDKEIIRVNNQSYNVITDSIYARLPGSILYQNGKVYWQDAISADNFMHVVDVASGKEVASFGSIGEGPEEMTLPIFSLSDKGLYMNDTNKPLEQLWLFDKNTGVYFANSKKYQNDAKVTRLLHFDSEVLLSLCPAEDKLFAVKKSGNVEVTFGERPIKEDINNAYNIFQGNVEYNVNRDLLVYSNMVFPYVAIYKQSGVKKWEQVTELKGEWDYSISEGKLKFASSSPKGASELALTEDYIVLLQRDNTVEEFIPRERAGRDPSTLPKSLFVYDYKLNLKKIINMPFNILRLCGDTESNTVYAIGMNPDFELINIKL